MKPRVPTAILALSIAAMSATAFTKDDSRFRFDEDNTPGWVLMSEEERTEYGKRMAALKTYEECQSQAEIHRKQIEQRANERHTTLRPPRANACDEMKAPGLIK